MSATEKFCLRWNDFESNISVAFRELREEKDFFDVTLSVGPGHQHIQAHKLILSACSPFFRGVLRQNPHAHPLLYLKGVGFSELQSVLNFMYHGEVNVAQEELNTFLAVAEELQVKGLTQGGGSNPSSKPKSDPPPSTPRPRPAEPSRAPAPQQPRPRPAAPTASSTPYHPPETDLADDDIQEVVPIKTEMPTSYQSSPQPAAAAHHAAGTVAHMEEEQYGEEGYDDYGGYEGNDGFGDGSMMEGDQNKGRLVDLNILQTEAGFSCGICGKEFAAKSVAKRHVKEQHMEMGRRSCPICGIEKHRSKIQNHIDQCQGQLGSF